MGYLLIFICALCAVGSSNVDALASHIEPEDVELHSKAEKSASTVCASYSVYKVYKIFNASASLETHALNCTQDQAVWRTYAMASWASH